MLLRGAGQAGRLALDLRDGLNGFDGGRDSRQRPAPPVCVCAVDLPYELGVGLLERAKVLKSVACRVR
jgi:hypothetical protein